MLSRSLKPDDPTIVILHPRTGEYYTLDEVGSRIWQLCDGSRSVAEITVAIGQEYEAPSDVIEADVLDLVKDLIDEALLVRDP